MRRVNPADFARTCASEPVHAPPICAYARRSWCASFEKGDGDMRSRKYSVSESAEPFASAAVKAVKQWKYEPARYKGQPITVYRIIQIPFKLNV